MIIEFNGERKTASEWSEITGIRASNIYSRNRLGWQHEKILGTPVTSF